MIPKPMQILLCSIGLSLVNALPSASERPNVLFISIDDLNDMPTFMGRYPDAITPNMDRLASQGIIFRRAHAQVPLCGPSRASVMTSTLATTHGFHGHISDRKVQLPTEMPQTDDLIASDQWHFQKESLWERSSHVPLVFAGPNIKPKQICGRVVSLIDILPTLADLCDLPKNKNWQGRSIRPLIENPSKPWNHPALTTWQGNNVAVQTEGYRYIHYVDGSEELYAHDKDLNEWTNLSIRPEYASLKKKLRAHIPKQYVELTMGKQQTLRAEQSGENSFSPPVAAPLPPAL